MTESQTSAPPKNWTAANLPALTGRSFIVTGAGGLGYETALALARAGAEVTLAGRNIGKGEAAVNHILANAPAANVRFETLDLASLASVVAFGERLCAQRASLDGLINNAGVMAPPTRRLTQDGFELQFGTNFLGHFALTALLMPLLKRGNRPRVVHVASLAHRSGQIRFDDLQSERDYRPMKAYAQSKLANLMFAFEMQRRALAAGWGVESIAAHPGVSHTGLVANGAGAGSLTARFSQWLGPLLLQPAAQGALPILFAAAAPQAAGGAYYGPDGWGEIRGLPALARPAPQSQDASVAARLWGVAKDLVRIDFDAIAKG